MKKIFVATGFVLVLLLSVFSAFGQTQSREDLIKEIEAKRKELSVLEERLLSANEYRLTYAEFLRQPDTGLIRLLPREKFDGDAPRGNVKRLTIRGGGAYYSFARLTHEYGFGSDIELAQGSLLTGFAGADYGILVDLGNVPLENLTVESPAVQPLAKHQVFTSQHQTTNDLARRLPVKADHTYLLRSINYNNSDVLVAFKVVRIDSDESAVILWKLMQNYPTPKLSRR